MSKYIDKDAIVAEIKKRYEYWREKEHNSHSIESETRMSECQHLMLLFNTIEAKDVDLIINTIIAECCDWLGINTNLSHDKIEDCRNLMLKVKEEQFKAQESTEDEHWREVRERAAIAAMQGELANPRIAGCFRDYAEGAIKYADALIEQLKTQKEEQFKIQKGE